MARIGVKGLTYATVSGGGAGSAVTYTGGATQAGLMIRADVTISRDDVSQYADNGRVEHANGANGVRVALELAALDDTLREKLLGFEKTGSSSNITYQLTDAESPYVGFGYITSEIKNGVKSFIAYWFYKMQFNLDGFNAETKGESTSFQSESITGTAMGVQLAANGAVKYFTQKTESTEAAARTWLNGQAGIT